MALRDKLRTRVQPFLEPDEQVRQVFLAQSGMNPMVVPLFGALIMLLATHPKIVVVTDRGIVVLKAGKLVPSKPKAVEARGPQVTLGPVKGLWAKIHLGEKMYVHKRFHKDVEAADAALGSAPPQA
jgi:hypothetical protein